MWRLPSNMSRDLDPHLAVLQPQASRIYIRCLPLEYCAFICDILDPVCTDGVSDHRKFGELMGTTLSHVQALRANNNGQSVTGAILDEFQHRRTIWDLILILHQMGVAGLRELRDVWPDIERRYEREQEQLVASGREGDTNTEGSCACVTCQMCPPQAFYGLSVSQSPQAPHRNRGYDQRQIEEWMKRTGHPDVPQGRCLMVDQIPVPEQTPQLQERVRGTSMNIPPQEGGSQIQGQTTGGDSGRQAGGETQVRRFDRHLSDEDNCSYGLVTDGDHMRGCTSLVAGQNGGGSPAQGGLMEGEHMDNPLEQGAPSNELSNEMHGVVVEYLDGHWLEPDNCSNFSSLDVAAEHGELEIVQSNPSHQASIVSNQRPMAEGEGGRVQDSSSQQMACLYHNGNSTGGLDETSLNVQMENITGPEFHLPAQGYPDCQDSPLEQTLRKEHYSTTEAYHRQHYPDHGQLPPPQPAVHPGGYSCPLPLIYSPGRLNQQVQSPGGAHIYTRPQPNQVNHPQVSHLDFSQLPRDPTELTVVRQNNNQLHTGSRMADGEHQSPTGDTTAGQAVDHLPAGSTRMANRAEEQPVKRRQDCRKKDPEEKKRFSDPPSQDDPGELRRHHSDDGIDHIYQREEHPARGLPCEKFVFMTGGETNKRDVVEKEMWKLCMKLNSAGITVVANLQKELVALPGDPLELRHSLRENFHEAILEYYRQATCVLLVVSPGYIAYTDRNTAEPHPTSHRISTRLIHTELIHEHCQIHFCKNKRIFPVKLRALETRTRHIPDWIASTLIYSFPSSRGELIQHLRDDIRWGPVQKFNVG